MASKSIEAIVTAMRTLGVNQYHTGADIINEASSASGLNEGSLRGALGYMYRPPNNKWTPTTRAEMRVNENGIQEFRLIDGEQPKTTPEEDAVIEADVEAIGEYENEKDIYPVLVSNGYVDIAKYRGLGRNLNPDVYRIVSALIESGEVKNELTMSDFASAITEALGNGAYASYTVLIYVKGPDEAIVAMAKIYGVGVRKVVGKEVVEILAPRIHPIDADHTRMCAAGNAGIAMALADAYAATHQ